MILYTHVMAFIMKILNLVSTYDHQYPVLNDEHTFNII